MKRILALCTTLCVACGGLFAQDSTLTPDEAYVLEKARQKYEQSGQPGAPATAGATEESPTAPPPAIVPPPATAPTDGGSSKSVTVYKSDTTVVTVEVTKSPRDSSDDDPSGDEYPYFPFVVSFVPGLSIPFGTYDTSMAYGAIGSLVGSLHGIQGAGVFCLADGPVRGFQGAGVFNIAEGLDGFQGAGVFNIAEDVHGFQGAGVFNIADDVEGVQTAGVFNIADRMDGFQAAGVINVNDKGSGVMLGLINVSDEFDGVAIGLLNFIGNGVNDLGIDYQFASDTAYATLRSGTRALYASVFAGLPAADLARSAERLTVGAGLGHRFRVLFMSLDAELGTESSFDPVALNALASYLRTGDEGAFAGLAPCSDPFARTFGFLRLSLGFGERRGFGPYAGIKTDFAVKGSGAVPGHLRSAFGAAAPYELGLFGYTLEFWPKWFVGIQF